MVAVFSGTEADANFYVQQSNSGMPGSMTRNGIPFATKWGDKMNIQELLGFNLFLQVFDGTASYFVLSKGEAQLNTIIAAASDAWGLFAVLLVWKVIICGSLLILYSLRHRQPSLPRMGLTVIAIVYSSFAVSLAFHLLESAI